MLKASIRSFNLPDFGTDMVNVEGNVIPSHEITIRVILRIVVDGNGKERYINGSNVTDNLLQAGHTNVDRY